MASGCRQAWGPRMTDSNRAPAVESDGDSDDDGSDGDDDDDTDMASGDEEVARHPEPPPPISVPVQPVAAATAVPKSSDVSFQDGPPIARKQVRTVTDKDFDMRMRRDIYHYFQTFPPEQILSFKVNNLWTAAKVVTAEEPVSADVLLHVKQIAYYVWNDLKPALRGRSVSPLIRKPTRPVPLPSGKPK